MKPYKRRAILAVLLFALLLPLLPLVIWSFALRWDFPQLLPQLNPWAWGELGSEKILRAIAVSIPLSLTVMLLSLLLAFFPAKALGSTQFRGKRLVELLLLLPTFLPQISVVFGMQQVFRFLGVYSTAAGVILAQLAFQAPYMTLLLSAVFRAYDPAYAQQAACLGVGRWAALWHVTLPAVRPGVTVSCVFSFIGSWGTYLTTAVIGPPDMQTLPVLLFPMLSSGNNSYPLIAAVTLVYIAPVLLFLAASSRVIIGQGFDPRGGRLL